MVNRMLMLARGGKGALVAVGMLLSCSAPNDDMSTRGDGSGDGSDTSGSAGEGADPTGNAGGSVVSLRFSVPMGVRSSANLEDELVGTVYGSIFLSEDVSVSGPIDGAESVASVEVVDVDLREQEQSEATWMSDPLLPGMYTFLGFYDVDANGDDVREPDDGDPVTLPSINAFTLVEGQDHELVVSFDLVL